MPLRINDLYLLVRTILLNTLYFQDPVMHFRPVWNLSEPQPNPSLRLHDIYFVLDNLLSLAKLSALPCPQEP